MSIELPVLVEKVVFRNEKGFAILAASLNAYSSKYKPELEELLEKKVKKNKYNNFTITIGCLDVHERVEGRQYIFIGDFIKNEKYGDQFKSDFYYSDSPSTEDGLREYLMEFPNIKEVRSNEIIKTFGFEETLRILNEEPNKLLQINGINEKRLTPIKQKWDAEKSKRGLYMWLIDHGIPPKMGSQIYGIWFDESLKILTENPYRLTEIKGFGFKTADFIAHKILKEVPKAYRMASCMHFVLNENLFKNSNLCMPISDFKNKIFITLQECSEENSTEEFVVKEYEDIFNGTIKSNLDKFVAVKNVTETTNGTYVYLKEIWEKEKYIANEFYKRSIHPHKIHNENEDKVDPYAIGDDDIEDAEKDVSSFGKRDIKLDDCQKDAIKSSFQNKITVITGGGGTGKSTICRCIYHLAEEKHLTVRMMSPTGKASQVMVAKTGFPAETIHRSLKMQPGDDFPKEHIREDMVIIDEVSMVGVDTMFSIMNALEDNAWCHVVFVGDCNQLPSVSPGNFLSDIMQSGIANVVPLTKIHRQNEDSYIAILANEISAGKIVEIPEKASDIKWHDLNNSKDTFDVVIRGLVQEYVKNNNIDDLQIIAPMYRGEFGVNKINEIVQDLMSKENETTDRVFNRGFHKYYVGDRVIQLENNYSKDIFNGDIGKIVEAGRKITNPEISDEQSDFVTVNFYGEELTYINDEIDQLKLAWCITIHKFQGSQSPYIYFVFSRESNNMASKELLYTGMTRAEKHLDIYGHRDVFRMAPTKSAIRKRYTNMNAIIKELKENRKILKVLEEKKAVPSSKGPFDSV